VWFIAPVRVLIIGNPTSGGGKARAAIAALEAELSRRGHEVEAYLTKTAGDGGRRAGELGDRLDALVVAGGDGTLNEVLNGLEDPGAVPLTQLAMGTANILAHELRLPTAPGEVARMLEGGRLVAADLGELRRGGGPGSARRFLMVVSAGFDALVTREIRQTRKGTLGYLGYVKPVMRVLARYRPPRLRVTVDGRGGYRGAWVIVSKTRNYGGLFTVAERARVDSGQLEVLVFERAGLPHLAEALLRGLGGRGLSTAPGVLATRGTRVRIESDEPVDVEVDGDHWGEVPAEVELHPGRVRLFVPQGGAA